eukprot:g34907.t1
MKPGYKMKQSEIADKDTSFPDVLDAFYAWFEQNASSAISPALHTPVPSVTTADVRSVFLGVNPRKATSADRIPSHALRSCVGQLAEVFTDIFNLSLLQAKVPICFKTIIIIPVSKKAHITCLNDYCPVALISRIMNCLEKLVMTHINSSLPAFLHPLQFAYRCNRKKGGEHAPIYINRPEVESVEFLGVIITDNLSWTSQVDATVKNAQYCFYFLRKFGTSIRTLTNFHRHTTESVLSGCITA